MITSAAPDQYSSVKISSYLIINSLCLWRNNALCGARSISWNLGKKSHYGNVVGLPNEVYQCVLPAFSAATLIMQKSKTFCPRLSNLEDVNASVQYEMEFLFKITDYPQIPRVSRSLLKNVLKFVHLTMHILYTTQCCSINREVITTSLHCKHWKYLSGRLHSSVAE